MIEYDFGEKFSSKPGPRYKKLGPYSGEEFRNDVLQDWFKNDKEIIIDVDNVILAFGPSFLSESFGAIAKEYGKDKFFKVIHFKTNSDKNIRFEIKVKEYIERALNK